MIACSDCAQVFRAKRFSVVPKHAVICVPDSTSLNPNEKLTAFVELELAIRGGRCLPFGNLKAILRDPVRRPGALLILAIVL